VLFEAGALCLGCLDKGRQGGEKFVNEECQSEVVGTFGGGSQFGGGKMGGIKEHRGVNRGPQGKKKTDRPTRGSRRGHEDHRCGKERTKQGRGTGTEENRCHPYRRCHVFTPLKKYKTTVIPNRDEEGERVRSFFRKRKTTAPATLRREGQGQTEEGIGVGVGILRGLLGRRGGERVGRAWRGGKG